MRWQSEPLLVRLSGFQFTRVVFRNDYLIGRGLTALSEANKNDGFSRRIATLSGGPDDRLINGE
jgi:hypothetical protein